MTIQGFEPIQPFRLAREIADRISSMILGGQLECGARLPPERELAIRFSVSRPTVREAVHVLEALGLVEVRPGGGTFVARKPSAISSRPLGALLNQDDKLMLEMAEVRKEFEVRNAELAAKNATDADIQALAEILADMEAETAQGRDRYELDVDFHLIIAEASRNRIRLFITTSLLRAHFDLLRDARMRMIRRERHLLGDFLREHRAVYLAIRERNPDQACQAMLAHLEAVHANYSKLLIEGGVPTSRLQPAESVDTVQDAS
jgi:GntR family transcriptional repressor for pyruvate dehydrogenase complex